MVPHESTTTSGWTRPAYEAAPGTALPSQAAASSSAVATCVGLALGDGVELAPEGGGAVAAPTMSEQTSQPPLSFTTVTSGASVNAWNWACVWATNSSISDGVGLGSAFAFTWLKYVRTASSGICTESCPSMVTVAVLPDVSVGVTLVPEMLICIMSTSCSAAASVTTKG